MIPPPKNTYRKRIAVALCRYMLWMRCIWSFLFVCSGSAFAAQVDLGLADCCDEGVLESIEKITDHRERGHRFLTLGNELTQLRYDCAPIFYLRSLDEFSYHGDTIEMIEVALKASMVYRLQGKPIPSLNLILMAIDLGYSVQDLYVQYAIKVQLTEFCHYSGDYEMASTYALENLELAKKIGDRDLQGREHFRLGNSLRMRGKYTEALAEYGMARTLRQEKDSLRRQLFAMAELGKTYLGLKKLDKALSIFKEVLSASIKKASKIHVISDGYLNLANCYNSMHQYDSALYYAEKGFQLAIKLGNAHLEKELNRTLSRAYSGKKNFENALNKYQRFTTLKTLTEGKEVTNMLLRTTLNAQLLAMELEAKAAQKETLTQKRRFYLFILLSFFIGATIFLIGFYVLLQGRYRRLDLQTKMLVMKMDPHFIGNLLTAVQDALYSEPIAKVETYLVNSAQHIRQALERSYQEWVSIEKELEALERYVSLQKLRFGNQLNYKVVVDEHIDLESSIPCFLLQPLLENAIDHGLKKGNHGLGCNIVLEVQRKDQLLHIQLFNTCHAGKEFVVKHQVQKKSRSLQIINSRLKLYSKIRIKPYRVRLKGMEKNGKMGMNASLLIPYKPVDSK